MERKEIKREGTFSSFFCFLYFQIDFIAMAQKRATVQDNYMIFLYGKFVLVTQKKVTNNLLFVIILN